MDMVVFTFLELFGSIGGAFCFLCFFFVETLLILVARVMYVFRGVCFI